MGDRAGFGECFQERGGLMLEEDGDEETTGCAGEEAAGVSRVPGFADDNGLDTGGDAQSITNVWNDAGGISSAGVPVPRGSHPHERDCEKAGVGSAEFAHSGERVGGAGTGGAREGDAATGGQSQEPGV